MCSTGWADEPTAQPFASSDRLGNKLVDEAEAPSFATAAADAVLGRPVLFVTTVVGAGIFVVTLPFSLLSGSVKQAGQTLVGTPARATFDRCLGCSFDDGTEHAY